MSTCKFSFLFVYLSPSLNMPLYKGVSVWQQMCDKWQIKTKKRVFAAFLSTFLCATTQHQEVHFIAVNNAISRGEQCRCTGWTMPLHGVNIAVARGEHCCCTAATVPLNRCHRASEQVSQCLGTGVTVPPHGLCRGSEQPVSNAWNKLYIAYETNCLRLQRLLTICHLSHICCHTETPVCKGVFSDGDK